MNYDSACYCDELAEVDYGTTVCVFCEMESEHRLETLAHNLAIAAGLCAAYSQGVRYQPWPPSETREPYWFPGCGRAAP